MDRSEEKGRRNSSKSLEEERCELEEYEKKVFAKLDRRKSGVAKSLSELNITPPATWQSSVISPAYEPNPLNVAMKTNYFLVVMQENWDLFQYCVTFTPDVLMLDRRKAIVRHLKKEIADFVYIFDGMSLISTKLLVQNVEESKSYSLTDEKDQQTYKVNLELVKKASRDDSVCSQVYNLILRRCMFALGLEEIGRNFYDRKNTVSIATHKVELWPGYVTSMRQYDHDVLLSVEIMHRVLRVDNILNLLNSMMKMRNYKSTAGNDLKNSIVMTQYNRKTYRVDDIDWETNPTCSFDMKGQSISYIDYYKKVYNQNITDETQPLLICRPATKDRRDKGNSMILLVPELCQVTGLSDSMRSDMGLMRALAEHLHMSPENRAKEAEKFIFRFSTNEKVQQCLTEWHMEICPELIRCPFNILKKELIVFADGNVETNAQVDWTSAFRSRQMLKVKELKNWILVTPTRDMEGVNNLIRTAIKVAKALNFKIHPPKVVEIDGPMIPSYMNSLRSISLPIQLIFFIIPTKSAEPYTTIKRYLTIELGVPSQGFTSKNLYSKGIMSIVTKVVIQINAKLGGEPWGIRMPLKDVMVAGIDIQKCGNDFVVALTASNSASLNTYYNNVTRYSDSMECSSGILKAVKSAVDNFFDLNRVYPARVIIFREGTSEGQDKVLEKEAKTLMSTFTEFYKANNIPPPKFAYVACYRKSGTRLFAEYLLKEEIHNPKPGTVVQEKITVPQYPNFFLVAANSRQGCVSPCCYKVIHDNTKLSADKMQVLVYKLCHLYYNWSGTVSVPTPCQYSRKLAFVAGSVLKGDSPNKSLANSLHFL